MGSCFLAEGNDFASTNRPRRWIGAAFCCVGKTSLRRLSLWAIALMLLAPVCGPLRAQVAEQAAQQPSQRQGAASAGEKSTPIANAPEKKQEEKNEEYEFTHSAAVGQVGAKLGMDPDESATAFEIFNFLLLVVALGFVVLKTVPKAFRNRSSKIQKNLVDARTATEEATVRLNSVEARLAKLDEQIAAMRTQAEADSVREEQRLKANVEDEKAKILAAAEAEIQNATTLARREIHRYAAELAIEQAAKKLVVSAETDRLLVESFAHRLGGFDGDKGSDN
jgi:F-type H+-transporting ATPase subunit b